MNRLSRHVRLMIDLIRMSKDRLRRDSPDSGLCHEQTFEASTATESGTPKWEPQLSVGTPTQRLNLHWVSQIGCLHYQPPLAANAQRMPNPQEDRTEQMPPQTNNLQSLHEHYVVVNNTSDGQEMRRL